MTVVTQDMVAHGAKFFIYKRPGLRVLINGDGDMLVRFKPTPC